ncbi:MAG TPA: hypothetical protein VFZ09_40100 [Archangium sp.]|nr:hypothetical protein [Archangium sp.]HEX5752477.1 hypothetical protein [Archangium sp.]
MGPAGPAAQYQTSCTPASSGVPPRCSSTGWVAHVLEQREAGFIQGQVP